MRPPKTRYAKNGDVSIAYQVVGDGPLDVVFVPGYISHLDLMWSFPGVPAFLRRLASFSRLIQFDKRGTGLSDPVPGVPSLEERMEDLHAVLDAVGSERAALFGVSEGGPMSILFAATYPERTAGMVLYGSTPKFREMETFVPTTRRAVEHTWRQMDLIADDWGDGRSVEVFAPSFATDQAVRRAFALFERAAVSPAMFVSLMKALKEIDVTEILSAIGVPTLVLHRAGDPVVPVGAARYMADKIPGARFVELPGDDHIPWLGDSDRLVDEVEQFLTGARQSREPDRVLATVLFTDIVSSTARASELGDRRWRELLEAHDEDVRGQVGTHGGRVVKSLGDGYLATFDGPARAIRCGRAVIEDAAGQGIGLRAGVHTGECELLEQDVGGMAVHIGARVAAKAEPGELLVSSAVRDLVVGSGIEFEERGTHSLKGVPGSWALLAARDGARAAETSVGESTDSLAPNLGIRKPGDRLALRMVRSAPSLVRLRASLALRRAKRRAEAMNQREPD